MTSTIAANWMEFPVPAIVPPRTISQTRESGCQKLLVDGQAAALWLVRHRILRLELLVVTAIVGFGCFAWGSVSWESALRQTTTDQNQSLQILTANLARQDHRISEVTQSLDKANRDLNAQMNLLSRQFQEQVNQMAAIDLRLRRLEASVK